MRLAKFLAHSGVASRRASEQIVFDGRVTVAGEVVRDPARDVDGSEGIEVDGRPARAWKGERAVYAVNKPAGVVSTAADTHGRTTVVSLVPSGRRLYPVGRLDADTTGLILLTDDGPLAHRLTHPSFEVPRTYRAKVRRAPVRRPALEALRSGVELDDGVTAPARARRPAARLAGDTVPRGRRRPPSPRSRSTRAASAGCAGCSTRWVIPSPRSSASRSARSASRGSSRAP